MHLKTILNLVEKQKGFVYSKIQWADSEETAICVTLEPHGRSKPICSECGKKRSGYDRRDQRESALVQRKRKGNEKLPHFSFQLGTKPQLAGDGDSLRYEINPPI